MAAHATTEAVKARLRPILTLARERNVFVNFDMEQHDYCRITRRIFEEIFCEDAYRDWPHVGIVVQAYLRRSENDLHTLHDWAKRRGTPVWVRLVKGAYWDYETIIAAQRGHPVPVFARKAETDANFERLAAFLVDHWQTLRPAIATHNVRSAAHAQALADVRGLPPRTLEYQVLYGMGDPIGRALAAQGRTGARLRTVRRTAARHGLSGAPPARKHVERLVHPPRLHHWRGWGSGAVAGAAGGLRPINDLTPRPPLLQAGRGGDCHQLVSGRARSKSRPCPRHPLCLLAGEGDGG
jgi:hypothetical protein